MTGRPLRDINGDLIFDRVEVRTIELTEEISKHGNRSLVSILHVIPIKETQESLLMVAYRPMQLIWKLIVSEASIGYDIVFENRVNGSVSAVYHWSKGKDEYDGPSGAVNEAFFRLQSGDIKSHLKSLEEFARFEKDDDGHLLRFKNN